MKYIARVRQVLVPGIHHVAAVRDDGTVESLGPMASPSRLEIESEGGPGDPCMMYRYTEDGAVCGDTWHLNLAEAFEQAKFEYGLTEADWTVEGEEG